MKPNNTIILSRLIPAVLLHLLVSGAFVLLPSGLHAQKIGFVASEAIFEKLPEAKTARAKLAELQSGWMREIQRMEADIQKLRADQEKNRLLWSAQEKRDAESSLADLNGKLAAYRSGKFGPDGEYEKLYKEQMGPVLDKVQKAILEEARAQKFDFVFDKSSRGMPMLYANPANDLTVMVLKRMGVTLDSDTAGTSGPSGVPKPDPSSSGRSGSGASTMPDGSISPEDALKPKTDKPK